MNENGHPLGVAVLVLLLRNRGLWRGAKIATTTALFARGEGGCSDDQKNDESNGTHDLLVEWECAKNPGCREAVP